jgi:hypothetical protein
LPAYPLIENTIRMVFRLLFLLFLLAATTSQAQEADTTATRPVNATIFLKDGTQLRGLLLSESPVGIRIKTDNLGEIILTTDKIDRIEKHTEGFYRNGKYWFRNPNSTRYFFAPSALPLRKGEGYYQNAYIFVNSASVGVTDHFTMGGGFVLNPTFRDWQVVFLTPKVSFPSQSNVTFGVGAIAVGVFNRQYNYDQMGMQTASDIETTLAGIAYGVATFGNVERNASVGLGWGFANEEIGPRPVLNLSYMSRIGRKVGVVTENWIFIPNAGDPAVALLSGGVRFFGEKMSVDLAMWVPASRDIDQFIAVPYVDFVIKFGK